MTTATFSIGVGDTGPSVVENLKQGDGSALSLVGAANLTFHLYDATGTQVISAAGTIVDAANGVVSYSWSTPAPAVGGTYLRRWTVTLASGQQVSIPNDVDGYPVEVTDISVTPLTGSLVCQPWCSPGDVVGCGACRGAEFDTATLSYAIAFASDVLFLRSGQQWPGVCTDTVRPTFEWAGGVRGYGSYSITLGESFGTGFDRYARDYPDFRHTGAGPESEILLPGYPVNQIVQVRIDGAVLPASSYQIRDDRWLARTDGQVWPVFSQNLTLPATAVGTFEVVYSFGTAPPPMGRGAAAAYACEVAQACSGEGPGDCSLPPRVQTITRQGLQVSSVDPASLTLDNGLLGVPRADEFLATVNPAGLRERSVVLSPDTMWPAHRLR